MGQQAQKYHTHISAGMRRRALTHMLEQEYPPSVDLDLWRCCSGLICHANCCLGVPLQGESQLWRSWALRHGRCKRAPHFHFQEKKLWNSQRVSLHSLLETTELHTVLLHPIWMEIEKQKKKQGHKRSFSLCLPVQRKHSYMLRSFQNSLISLLWAKGVRCPPERGKVGSRKGKVKLKSKRDGEVGGGGSKAAEQESASNRSRSTLCRKLIGADSSGFKVCLFMTRLLPC